jgi:hypothetical protein
MLQIHSDGGSSEFFGTLMPCDFPSCTMTFLGMPFLSPSTLASVMFSWCLLPSRCDSKVDWDIPLAWQVLQLHFIDDIFFCSVPRYGSAAAFAF